MRYAGRVSLQAGDSFTSSSKKILPADCIYVHEPQPAYSGFPHFSPYFRAFSAGMYSEVEACQTNRNGESCGVCLIRCDLPYTGNVVALPQCRSHLSSCAALRQLQGIAAQIGNRVDCCLVTWLPSRHDVVACCLDRDLRSSDVICLITIPNPATAVHYADAALAGSARRDQTNAACSCFNGTFCISQSSRS